MVAPTSVQKSLYIKDYLLTDQINPNKRTYESLSGKLIYDIALGEGVVDFAKGFQALGKVGYEGAVSLEFDGSDEELRRSLTWLKTIIASKIH